MGSIGVYIPSYRRAGKVKTLSVAPFAKLVVAESEAEEYSSVYGVDSVVSIPDEVQGNIARVRNHILDNSGDDAVCMMDDDISAFGKFRSCEEDRYGYERERLSGDSLARFIERNTALCQELGLHLWGVNIQAANRLYHQSEPFSLTKQVLGPFCVHVRSKARYDEELPLKEDYDLFLQHLQRYGGVLRVNSAWYANAGSKGAVGGCAAMRDIAEEKRQFLLLQKKWGSGVVKQDRSSKREFDFNPKICAPVRGV